MKWGGWELPRVSPVDSIVFIPFRKRGIQPIASEDARGRRTVSVLLVNGHDTELERIGAWLSGHGYKILAARDPQEAIEVCMPAAPNVVVTDLDFGDGGLTGVDLLDLFAEMGVNAPVIALAEAASVSDVIRFYQRRGFDCLEKPLDTLRPLKFAIERAVIHSSRSGRQPKQRDGDQATEIYLLTDRERAVFALVLEGFSNEQVADRLCLSPKTVRNRLTLIYQKLNVSGRVEALARFRR